MMMGMVMSGSCNISEIGRSLNEKSDLKHTTKRLSRMLEHDHILDVCNQLCLEEVVEKIDERTILALDGGDISHQYGEKFELCNHVHDGSAMGNDKLKMGYWLNQISGYNESSGETFPVALDMFSTSEGGFKSSTVESLDLVTRSLDLIGTQGLWVMDRGYDNGYILDYFLRSHLNFAIRMKTDQSCRNVLVNGEATRLNVACSAINRRVILNKHKRFGTLKIELSPRYKKYKCTLICVKDKRNKEPMVLLVNGWIKSTKELKRRIRGYFRRWGVEESYRFEKQGFGIEKSTVRKFERIKTLLGMTLLSWLLLVKINEAPKLKAVVLKEAKMEKNKSKDRPKFIYYRLLKGVQKLFSGIRELFRFRWKKKLKQKHKNDVKNQRLLFPQLHPDLNWMELSA